MNRPAIEATANPPNQRMTFRRLCLLDLLAALACVGVSLLLCFGCLFAMSLGHICSSILRSSDICISYSAESLMVSFLCLAHNIFWNHWSRWFSVPALR